MDIEVKKETRTQWVREKRGTRHSPGSWVGTVAGGQVELMLARPLFR